VLDIGLPTLNRIEAARQIRKLSSKSKILFVTQDFSDSVVREALSLGARGYVIKADAGSELVAAVDAVRQGKLYLSRGLSCLLKEQPTPSSHLQRRKFDTVFATHFLFTESCHRAFW